MKKMAIETDLLEAVEQQAKGTQNLHEAFELQKQITLENVDTDLMHAFEREHNILINLEMTNNPARIRHYRRRAKQEELAIRHIAVARGLVYYSHLPVR